MRLRFAKLPIVASACLLAGVVIGLVLAPVSAQQPMSGIDGQVAVRSDYAVYLIANGQRRWIATVVITDEEINAYPEAEPIFSGVAALPAPPTPVPPPPVPASPFPPPPVPAAAPPAPAPVPPASAPGAPVSGAPAAVPPPVSAPGAVPLPPVSAPVAPAAPPSVPGAVAPAPPVPAAFPTPNGAVGDIDPMLPLEVDIDGLATFQHGNQITVVMRTTSGASCELTVRWPDATETAQPPQAADARGRCSYTVRVPSSVPNGLGLMKGSVRVGGRVSNQTVEFQIVSDVE